MFVITSDPRPVLTSYDQFMPYQNVGFEVLVSILQACDARGGDASVVCVFKILYLPSLCH